MCLAPGKKNTQLDARWLGPERGSIQLHCHACWWFTPRSDSSITRWIRAVCPRLVLLAYYICEALEGQSSDYSAKITARECTKTNQQNKPKALVWMLIGSLVSISFREDVVSGTWIRPSMTRSTPFWTRRPLTPTTCGWDVDAYLRLLCAVGCSAQPKRPPRKLSWRWLAVTSVEQVPWHVAPRSSLLSARPLLTYEKSSSWQKLYASWTAMAPGLGTGTTYKSGLRL